MDEMGEMGPNGLPYLAPCVLQMQGVQLDSFLHLLEEDSWMGGSGLHCCTAALLQCRNAALCRTCAPRTAAIDGDLMPLLHSATSACSAALPRTEASNHRGDALGLGGALGLQTGRDEWNLIVGGGQIQVPPARIALV